MASRLLSDLLPLVRTRAEAFLAACEKDGIDLTVTCTYRSREEQTRLYEQGRNGKPGPIVTRARPGYSWHQWRCALDVVPMRDGKCVWNYTALIDRSLWYRVGELGERNGLEWAWRWTHNREMAHFQYTGGANIDAVIASNGSILDKLTVA